MQYTNSTNLDHLRTYFLALGRALNRSGLEKELNLPRRTIRHWLAGEQRLPEHHQARVLAWARRFGYSETTQYDPIV